ncbi:MAG: HAD family hydrolase [Clostridia bacterium]|nr:HAD family hydrolase [Clostridia bacterium]
MKERTPEIRLLIFDLDGTLADTIESIRDGVNLAMRKYGYPERSYEQVRDAIGNGARELIRRSMPEAAAADRALVDRVFADYHVFYGETYANCRTCYEGIPEALATLKDRGYTLAVLSNKQDVYVKALVKSFFPKGWISHAEGQTEKPKKPDPTVPLEIAERLGFSPAETAFIGDSEVDVATARNARMTAVACSWGYRDRSLLSECAPDYLLDSVSELIEIFA